MIVVNAALSQDKIITLLEENNFNYVAKKGIKLIFETEKDENIAKEEAKALIKNSSFGSALYFNVEVTEG
ncbi:MAG: hypothetical protein LBD38_02135 [Streptococcaceae bacterium]|jgi:signal transduction histidine kinase|nr:hypothetical protein [Streptococcaceae bacterium]